MYSNYLSFPRGSAVRNPPAMQEIRVQSLGQEEKEGPLEKEMVTPSSILAWEIPWTREAWWATVHGDAKELDITLRLNNNSSNYLKIFKRLRKINTPLSLSFGCSSTKWIVKKSCQL